MEIRRVLEFIRHAAFFDLVKTFQCFTEFSRLLHRVDSRCQLQPIWRLFYFLEEVNASLEDFRMNLDVLLL